MDVCQSSGSSARGAMESLRPGDVCMGVGECESVRIRACALVYASVCRCVGERLSRVHVRIEGWEQSEAPGTCALFSSPLLPAYLTPSSAFSTRDRLVLGGGGIYERLMTRAARIGFGADPRCDRAHVRRQEHGQCELSSVYTLALDLQCGAIKAGSTIEESHEQ